MAGREQKSMPDAWPTAAPEAFYLALDELNAGRYYQCHETMEALWIPETNMVRELYQGVLQIATGCYHLVQRANWRGAVGLLERGARRLEHCAILDQSPLFYGVEWQGLIAAADRMQTHLRALGPAQIQAYDPALLPVVVYDRFSPANKLT